jgi:uncharacterized protein YxeA
MEDTIAIAIVLGLVVALVTIIFLAVRKVKKENAAYQVKLDELRAKEKKELMKGLTRTSNFSSVPPRGKETSVKYQPTYAPSPTQSVKSDDRFMDDMMTAVVINTLLHSDKDSISGTVTKNLDTNEVTFKDSGPSYRDSSPSYSDSSPSSSWSSSSSSSSSSSDSGSSWSSSDSSPSSSWD